MGVVINPNSELGRELAKHEQHHTAFTNGLDNDGNPILPGNPYRYRAFPSMLYKASERNGQIVCLLPMPHPHEFDKPDAFERAVLSVETFNKGAQRIVRNEDEMSKAKNEGWRSSPTDAMQALEDRRIAVSDAAAEAAFHVQRMSEQARAEYASAEAQTHEHVTDVVPVKKRGRPARGVVAVSDNA